MNYKNTLIAALLLVSPALQALEPATQAKFETAKKHFLASLYASGAVVTGFSGLVFAGLNIQKARGLQKEHSHYPKTEVGVHAVGTASCWAASWYLLQKAKETWKNN